MNCKLSVDSEKYQLECQYDLSGSEQRQPAISRAKKETQAQPHLHWYGSYLTFVAMGRQVLAPDDLPRSRPSRKKRIALWRKDQGLGAGVSLQKRHMLMKKDRRTFPQMKMLENDIHEMHGEAVDPGRRAWTET